MITEGIKYTGSKLKLLDNIYDCVKSLDVHTILDGFAGTTRVSQMFAQYGYDVTCNDISEWSNVFGNCYLIANKDIKYYQDIIDELNNVKPYKGWFSEHYGGDDEYGKKPFQMHNTMKLDGIRNKIDTYNISYEDKCVLLTSLILALDKVDNTCGHYVSYLSGWSKRSYNNLVLNVPHKFDINTNNVVLKDDIFNVITNNEYDLVYLDPPYGSNNDKMPSSRVRYESYYHIWKTVILNDKPEVFGKANRRNDSKDTNSGSVFEEYRKNDDGQYIATEAINKMIADTRAKYILLSYSSSGRTSKSDMLDILNNNGEIISALDINYQKNVMSNMKWTNEWLTNTNQYNEYLFLLKK